MPAGLPRVSSALREISHTVKISTTDFVSYLELPSASEYISSGQTAFRDVASAFKSVGSLLFLTLRPLLLLLLLLLRGSLVVLKFTAKHLFRGALVSTKKGFVQFRFGMKWLIEWQKSLSRTAVLIEVILVVVLALCYMLRRHIKKKQYVQRSTRWYKRLKRKSLEKYRKTLYRISQTSLFLAMLLPHVLFVGIAASTKLLFPRLIRWIATETYGTAILSFWYPLIGTISLMHQWREQHRLHTNKRTSNNQTGQLNKPGPVPFTPKPIGGARTGMYPRTTPKPTRSPSKNWKSNKAKSPIVQRWLRAAMTPATVKRRRANDERQNEVDINDEASFWLKYWIVYALFCVSWQLLYAMPIVGRVVSSGTVQIVVEEFQFAFFVWLFGLPLTNTTSTKDSSYQDDFFENRPLELLYQHLAPVSQKFYNGVSTAIPDTIWETIVSKVKSILELMVLLKLLSESTKERLLHIFEEGQALLPPSITLLMPGFTHYGVLYMKSIVPAAKSAKALSSTNSGNKSTTLATSVIMNSLEYWVLNAVASAFLAWWSGLLWWVPFSTHVIFIFWCHLQMPKSIDSWYKVLEDELMAFGLLQRWDSSDKFELDMETTVTLRIVRAAMQILPSAAQEEEEHQEEKDKDQMGNVSGTTEDEPQPSVNTLLVDTSDDEVESKPVQKEEASAESQEDIAPDPVTTQTKKATPQRISSDDYERDGGSKRKLRRSRRRRRRLLSMQ